MVMNLKWTKSDQLCVLFKTHSSVQMQAQGNERESRVMWKVMTDLRIQDGKWGHFGDKV